MTEPVVSVERGEHGIHVTFDCRNCGTRLGLDPKLFSIKVGVAGVSVAPEWFCPDCGIKGSILRSKIRVTGTVSLPPSGARSATIGPTARADAVVVNKRKEPAAYDEAPEAKSEPDVNCSDMTYFDLQAACKHLGLSAKGSRDKLTARLGGSVSAGTWAAIQASDDE